MDRKAFIWIGVGCVGACVICMLAVLIGGGVFFKWALQTPEDIAVDLAVPVSVRNGQPLLLEVTIDNLADQAQVLDSIDIDTSYLEGFIVTGTDPGYRRYGQYDFVTAFDSYYFETSIPANGSLTVRFYLQAVQAGDYTGSLDVCVNSATNCLERTLRTLVEQ